MEEYSISNLGIYGAILSEPIRAGLADTPLMRTCVCLLDFGPEGQSDDSNASASTKICFWQEEMNFVVIEVNKCEIHLCVGAFTSCDDLSLQKSAIALWLTDVCFLRC